MKSTTLIFIILAIFYGCSSLPPTYELGVSSHENKNFHEAVKNLELANSSTPNNPTIQEALTKAKYDLADQEMASESKLDKHDINKRIEKLSRSNKELTEANSYAEKELKQKIAEGSSMYESMRKKMSDSYKTESDLYAENLASRKKQQQKVKEDLDTVQSSHSKILKDAEKIQELSTTKPMKSIEDFSKYSDYLPYWPALAQIGENIKSNGVNYYDQKGIRYLKKNQFKSAKKMFDEGMIIAPDNMQSSSGLIAIDAKKMYRSKKYRESLGKINEALAANQSAQYLQDLKKTIQKATYLHEMNEAKKLTASKKVANKIKAFEIYKYIEDYIAEDDEKMAKQIKAKEEALRKHIAKTLVNKARYLTKLNKYQYSAIVLTLYQSAYGFDPSYTEKHLKSASIAKAIRDQKNHLKILLYNQRYPKEKSQFSELNQSIVSALETALMTKKLPGINIIRGKDKLSLKESKLLNEKPIPYKMAEVIIYHKIKSFTFKETGRDVAQFKSSQYISGQRMISNPEYNRAYNNWVQANNNYNNSYYQRQQALKTCNSMDNSLARSFCKGAVRGISTAARDSARSHLNNTPMQIPKNIISNYRYSQYNINLTGKIEASYRLADRRNGKMSPPVNVTTTINKTGYINENVEPSDQNGVKNGAFDVPDRYSEIEAAKNDIINQIVSKVTANIDKQYYDRFCIKGQQHLKKKRMANAAESFSLCREFSKIVEKGDLNFSAEEKAIAQYIGIAKDDIERYGHRPEVKDSTPSRSIASVEETPEAPAHETWPSEARQLSKKELKGISKFLQKYK